MNLIAVTLLLSLFGNCQPALPQSCLLLLLPSTSEARLARNLHPYFTKKPLGLNAFQAAGHPHSPTIAHLGSRAAVLDTLKRRVSPFGSQTPLTKMSNTEIRALSSFKRLIVRSRLGNPLFWVSPILKVVHGKK